jgi:hypothetical protein
VVVTGPIVPLPVAKLNATAPVGLGALDAEAFVPIVTVTVTLAPVP